MKRTIDYYDENALNYYEQTVNVCFDELYDRFLKYIPDGVSFISVKTGIETGYDENGRYMRNFTESDLREFAERAATAGAKLELKEMWQTADGTGRDVRWLNAISVMN